MRLGLVHSTIGVPAPLRSLTWKTCRREVHFLEEPFGALPPGAVVDADAYRLLLEVVCGLHSPIVGETEVQAQFKAFIATAAGAGRDDLARLCQQLLFDAKSVRHNHLQGFGARSYGALTRPHLIGRRLVLVGTGALAREIAAAAPPDLPLDVWGRRAPDGAMFAGRPITLRLLSGLLGSQSSTDPSTVVVAAPISSLHLDRVLESYSNVLNAVDLRAAGERTSWPAGLPLVTLDDVFQAGSTTDDAGLERLDAARNEIGSRSTAFMNRAAYRPFGWDDLCA
jgi:glutamyl-tRNA reductase